MFSLGPARPGRAVPFPARGREAKARQRARRSDSPSPWETPSPPAKKGAAAPSLGFAPGAQSGVASAGCTELFFCTEEAAAVGDAGQCPYCTKTAEVFSCITLCGIGVRFYPSLHQKFSFSLHRQAARFFSLVLKRKRNGGLDRSLLHNQTSLENTADRADIPRRRRNATLFVFGAARPKGAVPFPARGKERKARSGEGEFRCSPAPENPIPLKRPKRGPRPPLLDSPPGRRRNCMRRLYCTSILHDGAAAVGKAECVVFVPLRLKRRSALCSTG